MTIRRQSVKVSQMEKSLNYSDVFLVPQYSPVHSRSEISTKVKFGPQTFKSPAIPANMKCCIDYRQAEFLSANGFFYIMHRFGNSEQTKYNDMYEFVKRANIDNWYTISISVGVQDADKFFLRSCIENDLEIDYLTLDIAHGDSIRAKEMLEWIKSQDFGAITPFVIAGNVATPEAVANLTDWGADAIKVGVSNGKNCITFAKTGFGVPQFSSVLECANVAKVPLIADGGIRTNGDFAKAIRAGGTMVMAGSVFAACIDSPAENVYANRRFNIGSVEVHEIKGEVTHKKYFGSASSTNKGNAHHVEGTTVLLPVDQLTYEEKLAEITEDLQSACSYAGGSLSKLSTVPYGIR